MPWGAVPCCGELCHAMGSCAVPWGAVPCRGELCRAVGAVPFHEELCHALGSCAVPQFLLLFHPCPFPRGDFGEAEL